MKLLTNKNKIKILKYIAANLFIAEKSDMDIESLTKCTENSAEIAYLIAGISGMEQVMNLKNDLYKKIENRKLKNERKNS